MNIKNIIKESLLKVLGEAKKDLFPKNKVVSINSIKKYLKGVKPGITIHVNKKISYTKVEDNVFTSDKYTDLGLDQLANVMDQAFRKKQKVQVEEHVVTFTKDEMSKLHKDGKLTKKDDEGKDHDYIYNEEFELEKEKVTDPDDMRMYKEASLSKVYNAARKGSYPITLVAIEKGKVVDQKLVGTPEIVPAAFNDMKKEFPKAQVNVEDRKGKILFKEVKLTKESVNESVSPAKAADVMFRKLAASKLIGKQHKKSATNLLTYMIARRSFKVSDPKIVAGFLFQDLEGAKLIDKQNRNRAVGVIANLISNMKLESVNEASDVFKIFDAKQKLYGQAMDIEMDMKTIAIDVKQTRTDMEQEAEPEGGKVANRYGKELDKLEKAYDKKKKELKKVLAKLDKLDNEYVL